MKSSSAFVFCALFALCLLSRLPLIHAEEVRKPVQLIFDTDIGNDVDDVLALGVIHALQSRGECNLLAVTITKDQELAAPFVDAVNTFYGRGKIPIGVCKSGVTTHAGKFNPLAAIKDGDRFRYPHDLLNGKDAHDAVELLRSTLSKAKNQSIVIAQVGFSTNLANLLNSKADKHSELNGIQLVAQKVKLLSVMAGAFEKIPNNKGQLYDHKEYNIIKDLPSAKTLAKNWPTPIIWSGYEIGINLKYPHQSILQDYNYVKHHPLKEAYIKYNPPPHDRPTWDLTSVLYAVRPDAKYFIMSNAGTVTVEQNGLTTFKESDTGKHRYLIIPDDMKPRTLEALQLLSSQPPG